MFGPDSPKHKGAGEFAGPFVLISPHPLSVPRHPAESPG